jgi:hypothetical protein
MDETADRCMKVSELLHHEYRQKGRLETTGDDSGGDKRAKDDNKPPWWAEEISE